MPLIQSEYGGYENVASKVHINQGVGVTVNEAKLYPNGLLYLCLTISAAYDSSGDIGTLDSDICPKTIIYPPVMKSDGGFYGAVRIRTGSNADMRLIITNSDTTHNKVLSVTYPTY